MKRLFFVMSAFFISHNALASQPQATIEFEPGECCFPSMYKKIVNGKIVEQASVCMTYDEKGCPKEAEYSAKKLEDLNQGDIGDAPWMTPRSAERLYTQLVAAHAVQAAKEAESKK